MLSMITGEINFYLTPTFNKYPLYKLKVIGVQWIHILEAK